MKNQEQEFFDFVWKNEAAILAGNGFVGCYIGSIHPPHNSSYGEVVIYDTDDKFVDSLPLEI